ncbi:orotidine-5'-phosphate decarboxylase [Sphingopyxis sp. MG]|uniref:orotidine-5'-phosphate decarboxylase n=1 Tax=Sphingopyxis sp. MG TaxID=1866325 RepID=UPI0018F8B01A|nr:orotidine-5'-phosphate decarboxylase [Sphingopyxis sp. MG]
MHWGDTVKSKIETVGSLVLGIDPAPDHAPLSLCDRSDLFLERYVTALLDGAEGKVGFVKFQSAHFEAFGSDGVASLARCIAIARERRMAVILDAKRGDIGSTADAYARAYLVPGGSDLEVDCLTVNPFLGPETLEPFVNCARDYGKGLFILVKTSNPGSGWLQDQSVDGAPVSERVAETVAEWADETLGDCGIGAVGRCRHDLPVAGATIANRHAALDLSRAGLGFSGRGPARDFRPRDADRARAHFRLARRRSRRRSRDAARCLSRPDPKPP